MRQHWIYGAAIAASAVLLQACTTPTEAPKKAAAPVPAAPATPQAHQRPKLKSIVP